MGGPGCHPSHCQKGKGVGLAVHAHPSRSWAKDLPEECLSSLAGKRDCSGVKERLHSGKNVRVCASECLGEGHLVTRESGLNVKKLGWAQGEKQVGEKKVQRLGARTEWESH